MHSSLQRSPPSSPLTFTRLHTVRLPRQNSERTAKRQQNQIHFLSFVPFRPHLFLIHLFQGCGANQGSFGTYITTLRGRNRHRNKSALHHPRLNLDP